jgi:hypothetical protein
MNKVLEEIDFILKDAIYSLEYASFNYDGTKDENVPLSLIESTGVGDSCIISARRLKTLLEAYKNQSSVSDEESNVSSQEPDATNALVMKGKLINYCGFTHTNRNHLTIEVLGHENYMGNRVKIGDEIELKHQWPEGKEGASGATASKEIGEPLQNNSEEEAWQDVTKKWGATHKIEKVYGAEVILDDLEDNQSVCYGGKGFYFLLTKLNKSNQ